MAELNSQLFQVFVFLTVPFLAYRAVLVVELPSWRRRLGFASVGLTAANWLIFSGLILMAILESTRIRVTTNFLKVDFIYTLMAVCILAACLGLLLKGRARVHATTAAILTTLLWWLGLVWG